MSCQEPVSTFPYPLASCPLQLSNWGVQLDTVLGIGAENINELGISKHYQVCGEGWVDASTQDGWKRGPALSPAGEGHCAIVMPRRR